MDRLGLVGSEVIGFGLNADKTVDSLVVTDGEKQTLKLQPSEAIIYIEDDDSLVVNWEGKGFSRIQSKRANRLVGMDITEALYLPGGELNMLVVGADEFYIYPQWKEPGHDGLPFFNTFPLR